MPTSVVLWSAAALLLFWGVGAYNRLMRLRGDAIAAFAALAAELGRQSDLVRKELPAAVATQPAPLDAEGTFWAALQGAAGQLAASLAAARARPLQPEAIAALSSAQTVLAMAWERAERQDAHDMSGPRLPEAVLAQRARLALQVHAATEQFNQAVIRYNAGIAQFPAVLLAWLFGFKPGLGFTQLSTSVPK